MLAMVPGLILVKTLMMKWDITILVTTVPMKYLRFLQKQFRQYGTFGEIVTDLIRTI